LRARGGLTRFLGVATRKCIARLRCIGSSLPTAKSVANPMSRKEARHGAPGGPRTGGSIPTNQWREMMAHRLGHKLSALIIRDEHKLVEFGLISRSGNANEINVPQMDARMTDLGIKFCEEPRSVLTNLRCRQVPFYGNCRCPGARRTMGFLPFFHLIKVCRLIPSLSAACSSPTSLPARVYAHLTKNFRSRSSRSAGLRC
jgi:hypothetical protein